MCKSAETCLDAAENDRGVRMRLTDEVAVDHGGIVRSLTCHAAGGVGIGFAPMLADGIMVDHRVHIAAADQKAQTWRAEFVDRVGILPVGLGENCNLIARVLQHAADDGVPEGGVIDIGVPDDIDEIGLLPAEREHLPAVDRKKAHHLTPVEPKPPSPRRVSERVSASMNFAVRYGVRIICAMRSPCSMVWGTAPWLCSGTKNSPR